MRFADRHDLAVVRISDIAARRGGAINERADHRAHGRHPPTDNRMTDDVDTRIGCLGLSKKDVDRFAAVDWETLPEGSVFIKKSSVWLECSVYPGIPAGDHAIALLEIHGLRMGFERPLSVFHGSRFRRLAAIRAPRSPGNDRPPLRAEHP